MDSFHEFIVNDKVNSLYLIRLRCGSRKHDNLGSIPLRGELVGRRHSKSNQLRVGVVQVGSDPLIDFGDLDALGSLGFLVQMPLLEYISIILLYCVIAEHY